MSKSWAPGILAGLALAAGLVTAPVTATAASVPSLPHGITLSGLQDWLPATAVSSPAIAVPADRIATIEAQTYAAQRHWNANVVRFQIVQDKLVGGSGRDYSAAYMQNIRTVTDYALSLGLTVVLNAQTEVSTGFTRDEPLPTAATRSFWGHVMGFYANNPRVIFDLFNEPRHCSWSEWRRAMQGLVDYVRSAGAHNTVWVEGRWWGSTLAGVPLLRGQGIVYSFHHPGSPWPSQAPVTKATWNRAFGYLASRGIPVVDGEFVNYAGGYHWRHPRVMVRRYLRYLSAHHIGMTAWTLLPGVMNASSDYASTTTEPAGDGRQVKRWFNRLR
jgi:Cellulase (glycosyl hydrolase family 5)